MSDSVATSKRQRVTDPLREYTTWLYDRRVIDKEESTELYEIANQIDREHERRMREQCRHETKVTYTGIDHLSRKATV